MSQTDSQLNYWEKRWQTGDTGWDIGAISPPLKEYIDQLTNKELRILIPGCGNGYEAEYAWQNGFKNTAVVDLSETALKQFQKRISSFPQAQLLHADFFFLARNV